jgi:hypothetical protein
VQYADFQEAQEALCHVQQTLHRKKKEESTNFLFKNLPNLIKLRGRVEQATSASISISFFPF